MTDESTRATAAPDQRDILDDEGENLAVRAFLLYYGGGNSACPIISMRAHLARSGFDGCWPDWARAPNSSTLTKAGAQLWLRHLFSLEAQPDQQHSGNTDSTGRDEEGGPTDQYIAMLHSQRSRLLDENAKLRAELAAREPAPVARDLDVEAEHLAAIEEAAQTLESAAAHNRLKGRTVVVHTQQGRADRLRLALKYFAARRAAPAPVRTEQAAGAPGDAATHEGRCRIVRDSGDKKLIADVQTGRISLSAAVKKVLSAPSPNSPVGAKEQE